MNELKAAYKLPFDIAEYQLYTLFDGALDYDAEKLFSFTDVDTDTIKPIKAQKINILVLAKVVKSM